MVQWPGSHAPNAGGLVLIPGQDSRSHKPQFRPGTTKMKQVNIRKRKKEDLPTLEDQGGFMEMTGELGLEEQVGFR